MGLFYNGQAISDVKQGARGRAVLIECRSTTELDGYTEIVRLEGVSNSIRGKLRGVSLVRNQFGEIGKCKWAYWRVSTANPMVTGCPCCP